MHAWDLAAPTGRLDALDPELAEVCLENARRMVPAEPRGGPVPFGPAVAIDDTDDGLGPYGRLVAWLGRDPAAVPAERRRHRSWWRSSSGLAWTRMTGFPRNAPADVAAVLSDQAGRTGGM